MAQADRAYGKNLLIFSVGGNSLVAQIANCVIEKGGDSVDATCCADAAPANLSVRDDWSVQFEMAYDPTDAATDAVFGLIGSSVSFSCTAATGGAAYSGSGLLRRFRHEIPAQGQNLRAEIVPEGTALSVTP
jgi:hypothetical protein